MCSLSFLFCFDFDFPDATTGTDAGALLAWPISSSQVTGFLLNIGQSGMQSWYLKMRWLFESRISYMVEEIIFGEVSIMNKLQKVLHSKLKKGFRSPPERCPVPQAIHRKWRWNLLEYTQLSKQSPDNRIHTGGSKIRHYWILLRLSPSIKLRVL